MFAPGAARLGMAAAELCSWPRSNCKILPFPPDGVVLGKSYLSPNNNQHGKRGNGTAATQARRVHAASLYPHRRVALSRGLAGRQFQFSAYQKTDPEAGGRQVRRLL